MPDFVPDEVVSEWLHRQDEAFVNCIRRCSDCGQTNSHLMEDGSWICESCGHVEHDSGPKSDEQEHAGGTPR